MRHRVLACDFDGTLATEGVCSDETVEALERVAAAGIRLVLVTGRTREELDRRVRPRRPLRGDRRRERRSGHRRRQREGAAPRAAVPPALVAEFERTGVTPLVVGRVLCSTAVSQHAKLSAAIAKLGVDRQVVRNRDFGDGAAARDQQAHRARGGAARSRRDRRRPPSRSATARTTSRSSRSPACRSRSPTPSTPSRRVPTWCSASRTARASSRLAAALVAGDLGALTALSPLAG